MPRDALAVMGEEACSPFFVYGTLMAGFRNRDAVLTPHAMRTARATLVEAARVWHWPARGYPALELCATPPATAVEASPVRGELVWVHDGARALACVDALEDCYGPADPRSEYDRVRVTAVADGEALAVRAWTYVARTLQPRPGEPAPELVRGGCWRAHVARAGLVDAPDARFA